MSSIKNVGKSEKCITENGGCIQITQGSLRFHDYTRVKKIELSYFVTAILQICNSYFRNACVTITLNKQITFVSTSVSLNIPIVLTDSKNFASNARHCCILVYNFNHVQLASTIRIP